MRRTATTTITSLLLTGLLTLGVVAMGAGPAVAAKNPVKLSGTVNVEGKDDVSKDGNTTVDVELANFSFSPTFLKAGQGQTVTLALENAGSAPHTFTSDALDVDEELAPGDSTQFEITVPSTKGAFRFYCRFHQASGMVGAVYTKAGAKATNRATTTQTSSSGSTGYGY